MKKIFMAIVILSLLLGSGLCSAAEISSDKMILEWYPHKIWVDNGKLCMTGEFVNRRTDLTITKLNDFTATITFTKDDGSEYQFVGKPVKFPICKITPGGSKRLTFNFGEFEGNWKSWVTSQIYTFTYVNGVRW